MSLETNREADPSRAVLRLLEAGYQLPSVPVPIATYAPAVTVGSLIWTSGQIPIVAGELMQTGRVGEDVHALAAKDCAAQAALNAIAAMQDVVGNLDRIVRVPKVVVYVASAPTFTDQPRVADGASEILQIAFGEAGIHARSAVGVAVLPLNAPVEVELMAILSP